MILRHENITTLYKLVKIITHDGLSQDVGSNQSEELMVCAERIFIASKLIDLKN